MSSFGFLSTPSARRATCNTCFADRQSGAFLSTPSARRATRDHAGRSAGVLDFYPRPPRGGRPRTAAWTAPAAVFLSTPSARRATKSIKATQKRIEEFLSTPSARRATASSVYHCRKKKNFYPRPPRGGRLIVDSVNREVIYFYPRPPRGGRPAKWSFLQTLRS